jgi:DNA-binding transcriptional ArsR family regulator
VQTNTFDANRLRLAGTGLQDRVAEINIAGARLAREAGQDHRVAEGRRKLTIKCLPGRCRLTSTSRWPLSCLTKLTSKLTLTWRLSNVEEDDSTAVLDRVLEALANPHRRQIVYVLGLQPYAVSQLARMRGLSLPAIHKHIKVLENAGLVSRRKTGRTTYLTLNPRRLRLLQDWVGQFHTYWGSDEASFENYQSYLSREEPHRRQR